MTVLYAMCVMGPYIIRLGAGHLKDLVRSWSDMLLLLHNIINTDIAVRNRNHHTAIGNHMPYGITQCYMPPGSGDFPAFVTAKAGTRFTDPGGMQG